MGNILDSVLAVVQHSSFVHIVVIADHLGGHADVPLPDNMRGTDHCEHECAT